MGKMYEMGEMTTYDVVYTMEDHCSSGTLQEKSSEYHYSVTARVKPDDVMGMLIWFYRSNIGEDLEKVLVKHIYNECSGIEFQFLYYRDVGCHLWSFRGIKQVARYKHNSNRCEVSPCQFRKHK